MRPNLVVPSAVDVEFGLQVATGEVQLSKPFFKGAEKALNPSVHPGAGYSGCLLLYLQQFQASMQPAGVETSFIVGTNKLR